MIKIAAIPKEWLKSTCFLGHGAATCRYIAASSQGIICAKVLEDLKAVIDNAFLNGTMIAQGDNCEGYTGS